MTCDCLAFENITQGERQVASRGGRPGWCARNRHVPRPPCRRPMGSWKRRGAWALFAIVAFMFVSLLVNLAR